MYEVVAKLIILRLGENDQQGVTGMSLPLSNPTAISERLIALAGYRRLESSLWSVATVVVTRSPSMTSGVIIN